MAMTCGLHYGPASSDCYAHTGHENLERTYDASIRFDRIFPHGAFVLDESPRRRPISPQFGLDIRDWLNKIAPDLSTKYGSSSLESVRCIQDRSSTFVRRYPMLLSLVFWETVQFLLCPDLLLLLSKTLVMKIQGLAGEL